MNELNIGQWYDAGYPAGNYDHVPLRYEQRKFRVDAVEEQPVIEWTLKHNPHLRRLGRRLKVWCERDRRHKTFYEGAIKDPVAIEPPAELTGWQVIGIANGVETIAIPACEQEFSEGYCKGLSRFKCKAEARPFPLPDLRRNLAS